MRFTEEQQQAIDAREAQVLVSAAAGSGKTAVLVQRILKLLEEKTDIDRLLIVTFTEAAAAEMKERIADALALRLEADPTDKNLLRQTARLPAASICTIHAFCLRLVKDYFHLVDLDPSFRVGDQAELNLLQSQVMEQLFEDSYAANPSFPYMVETFGGGKTGDIRLDELIRRLLGFIESRPYPEEAVRAYAAIFNTPLDSSLWLDIVKEEIAASLDAAQIAVNRACELCRLPYGPEKYLFALQEDEEVVIRLKKALTGSLDEVYEAFSQAKHTAIYTYRGKEKESIDEDLRLRVKNLRDNHIKKRIEKVKTRLLFASPDKMREDVRRLQPVTEALLDLVMDYRARYSAEKRARNLVDFNDLEHYAIQTLWEGESRSSVARALSDKYLEVLVDEYQDTNDVQERILSAIASGRRFMVGDVKQSIYGFRHAQPKLFTEKLEKADVRSVLLSKNFRSRPEVLEAVNFFFSNLMGKIDMHSADTVPAFSKEDFTAELHVADGEEAVVIARQIKKLKNPGRDIVVLTRSLRASSLTEELKQQGIHAVAEAQGGFFETPEIMIALSLLKVVDNPRQDIDLLAVMRLYGFTPDEMLAIRHNGGEGDYYDCLLACRDKRISKFLEIINRWRKKAVVLPISRLIGVLYEETGLLNKFGAMPAGALRRANLQLLLEKAITYESTSFSGLFHFVRYIEWHRTHSEDEPAAMVLPENESTVRVMTIHKSKGLEFPVVFVSGLGRQFNRMDERAGVILHPDLGIGLMYTDLELRTRSNTMPRLALSLLRQKETVEEELRVLYVAMTRAKEKLVLTGCATDLEGKLEKWQEPLYDLKEGNSYLDWLMPYALRPDKSISLHVHEGQEPEITHQTTEETHTHFSKLLSCAAPWEPRHEEPKPGLPSKLAISELKRIYALEAAPDSTLAYEDDNIFDAPVFYKQAAGQLTTLRMGAILHTVVEHMDLHRDNDAAAIKKLVAHLADRGFLTCEEAEAVDISKLERFALSPLAERMRAARRLYREVPFVIGLSAEEVYGKKAEDVILVHGIIDCYFETEDNDIVLVDFKSGGNPDTLRKRYDTQMKIYRRAIEQAEGKAVKESLFYSFYSHIEDA